MKIFLVLFLLSSTYAVDLSKISQKEDDQRLKELFNKCDRENCPPVFIHLEKDYKPIYAQNGCCPIAFTKKIETQEKNKSLCYYNGQTFEHGQAIPATSSCRFCHCDTNYLNQTVISCNGVDCPYHRSLENSDCELIYENPEDCCLKEVCGEDTKTFKSKKCEYDGKSYAFGQQFNPNPDHSCICNLDWTGDLRNVKSCKKVSCDFELDVDRFSRGCEPVYFENRYCPIRFVCPDEVKSIEVVQKSSYCFEKQDPGTGDQKITKFSFNAEYNDCDKFTYNGEGGNKNIFVTYGECMDNCEDGYNTCELQSNLMPCNNFTLSYSYNKITGFCEEFNSACGANANSFETKESCEIHCQTNEASKSMMCEFEGYKAKKGDQVEISFQYSQPCVEAQCLSPPFFTFTYKSCPESPHPSCTADYLQGHCCPKYNCSKNVTVIEVTEGKSEECVKEKCPPFFAHLLKSHVPIYAENQCCPVAFKKVREDEPKNKSLCYSNGRTYQPEESIPVSSSCRKCSCSYNHLNETAIRCYGIDCPFYDPNRDDDCTFVYANLDDCCPEKVCGRDAESISSKSPCVYNGESYDYGDKFYPTNSVTCLCNDDWIGNLNNPLSCKKKSCDYDIDAERYEAGCQPIYVKGSFCPVEFVCPEEVVSIVVKGNAKECGFEIDRGTGDRSIKAFGFDADANDCIEFTFKGAGGNLNSFPSYETCRKSCEKNYNVCELQKYDVPCDKFTRRYSYNKITGLCEESNSACGTNENSFSSIESCESHCRTTEESRNMVCKFNKTIARKGDPVKFNLRYAQNCLQAECISPPYFTFTYKTCQEPDNPNCVPKHVPGECCPTYDCTPKKKVMKLPNRFFQHEVMAGCEAVYEEYDQDKRFPVRFNCPPTPPLSDEFCYVARKLYMDGQNIDQSPPCKQCVCNAKKGQLPRIDCLNKQCGQIPQLPKNESLVCYYTFEDANSCCPEPRCETLENLKSCFLDDKPYYDGQKFTPRNDPCKTCHCNSNWTGVDGPTCTQKRCNLKFQADKILRGCIPVYLSNLCCPVNWICPPPNAPLKLAKNSTDMCSFNGTEYSVGDHLEYEHRSNCISCSCVAPPTISCVEEMCPRPPQPRQGFRCVSINVPGQCCNEYKCDIPLKLNPCDSSNCEEDERCVRLVDDCPLKPCKEYAKCVPKNYRYCDQVNCTEEEVCVWHQFKCPHDMCAVRAACLPKDPCELSKLQCGDKLVCKNLIPSCSLSPCPRVATCVDPCHELCNKAQECVKYSKNCEYGNCPLSTTCVSLDCPSPSCDSNSEFQPFGYGKGNCPFCKISANQTQQAV